MAYLFVIFLGWISFFPEPVQGHYAVYVRYFLTGLFLLLLIRQRDVKTFFKRCDSPLFLFLIFILGGIFSAQDKTGAFNAYLNISIGLLLLYYLTKSLFSQEESIGIILKSICIFSLIVALFGIIEYAIGRNFIYEHIVDNIFYKRYSFGVMRRPMSTQFNPAVLGSFLLGCMPFGFLLIKDKLSFFRVTGLLSIILSIIVIILAGSRGVFLGMIALFLFYLWKKKGMRFSALFLVFIVFVVTLCSRPDAGRFNRFGFNRLLSGSHDSAFSEYRSTRLFITMDMLKDKPFFGIGLNNFRDRFDDYTRSKEKIPHEFKIADNMYLTLLAETGIIGFSSFLVFIFLLFRRGFMALRRLEDKRKKDLLLVSMSALMGLLVNMAAYELFYWHNPFALFCILCGMTASQLYEY
ncbi:MAG: O-antigen ligase family protein [Candidatus Gorgyraea atricola]|nr:O-antigen ligase family protein [Candidatus Gorgyraea atricola]